MILYTAIVKIRSFNINYFQCQISTYLFFISYSSLKKFLKNINNSSWNTDNDDGLITFCVKNTQKKIYLKFKYKK